MAIALEGRIETIEMRRHADGWVEVLTAPPLSAITEELLAELDDKWRDPMSPDVLVFAPGIRYLIGAHHQALGIYVLQRLA